MNNTITATKIKDAVMSIIDSIHNKQEAYSYSSQINSSYRMSLHIHVVGRVFKDVKYSLNNILRIYHWELAEKYSK